MEKEKLILSLIKDDLIHYKLVYSLNEKGLQADIYFLHLGSTIFKLMGFEENEETEKAFETYMDLTRKSLEVDLLESNKGMDDLAKSIYNSLLYNH